MTRKIDIRKACREVAKQAKAQQASRVDELERSLACAALAKPIKRSTAMGGQVDILSVESTPGSLRRTAGAMFVRLEVLASVSSTVLVVWTRVSL